jgi:hypothetical protein
MSVFKDNGDPLEREARELKRRLEKLRAEMRRVEAGPPPPKSRVPSRRSLAEFPKIDPLPRSTPQVANTPLVNDQGVAKFDLPGAIRRLGAVFTGATGYNKHMVRMLASGSIDGLPVLRREKKRALYRFLLLSALFLIILWGIGFTYFRER